MNALGLAAWSGTSFAAPIAAGLAAAFWSEDPKQTAQQIKDLVTAPDRKLGREYLDFRQLP